METRQSRQHACDGRQSDHRLLEKVIHLQRLLASVKRNNNQRSHVLWGALGLTFLSFETSSFPRVPTAAVTFHLCVVFVTHIDLGWAIASPIVYA